VKDKCPDCGTGMDQPHKNDCDVQRCSKCGCQRVSCDCDGHNPILSAWTGEWPGYAAKSRLVENEISEDEFESRFPLLANHLDSNASWNGCMFETFGQEVAFVLRQDPRTVWTLVDDDGRDALLSGCHSVNRIGYFISTLPVPDGAAFEVRMSR